MAGNGKLIVFVSSTMDELALARRDIQDTLGRRGIQPWAYEVSSEGSGTPLDTCLEAIERADLYVAVFSQQYGPITAREYRHARCLRKPCLVYIFQGLEQQRELKEFLAAEVLDPLRGPSCTYVRTTEDLCSRVGDHVLAWVVRQYRELTAAIAEAEVRRDEVRRLQEEADQLRAMTRLDLPHGTPLDYMARQMRAWFTTLEYRVDPQGDPRDSHFDWLVHVPVRRGFDRILVRGMVGIAEAGHVRSLRSGMEERTVDEGWLVAVQSVSPGAREEVEREATPCVRCYTFDELLEEEADFTGYFDWLEDEVRRQQIDKTYVQLSCTKAEFHPATGEIVATSSYDAAEGGVEQYLDRWLDDPTREHASILGEFGTGKTWLTLHYAWKVLQAYRAAKDAGLRRPRVPLVIPLRDYAKAVTVSSLFSEFFFRKHDIGLRRYSLFEQLSQMGKLLLIFDGFDEMAARVDRQKMIENFWELARVIAVPGVKVILTCRTEHFPDAMEGRALLSPELRGSTDLLTGESPQFEIVELEKFSEVQVRDVLSRRGVTGEIVDRLTQNPDLMDLARRPLMIEFILEALPELKTNAPVDVSRVYLYAVRRKMERDIATRRSFTSLADKLYFLCETCWTMLATDQSSLNYRAFPEQLRRLFGSVLAGDKEVDHWRHDMAAQTMLIPSADGDYTPAHRSLVEFFVAYKLVAELGVLADDFTDVARAQSHIDGEAAQRDYTWSDYFRRTVDERDNPEKIAPLATFVTERIEEVLTPGRAVRAGGSDASGEHLVASPGARTDFVTVAKLPPGGSDASGDHLVASPGARTDFVTVDKLPPNALTFAAHMVSDEPASHDRLCETAWEGTGYLAWNALSLLPFLKYESSQGLAKGLIERSGGGPLRSGLAWVVGELGVASDEVLAALRRTVSSVAEGTSASASAWWESGFALEKLGALGPRKGRQGDEAIGFLVQHLPPNSTLESAREGLIRALQASDPDAAKVNQCDVVSIVQHEAKVDGAEFFRDVLAQVDFSADTLRRRCYYAVWLCGHLGIQESVPAVLRATRNPLSSVCNCASEALGKIGVKSPEVVKALEDRLDDGYYRTRFHAAWSLGELGATESMPRLTAVIKVEEVRDVREEMIRVRDSLEELARR